jgi:hypothetical protein
MEKRRLLEIEESEKKGNRIVIIIGILIIFTLVILAGWMNGPRQTNPPVTTRIYGKMDDKSEYWVIEIIAYNGGRVKLTDIEFDIINNDNIQIFKFKIEDANPKYLIKGNSTVYPMPSGNKFILDYNTRRTITKDSLFESYMYCCIAFSDSNSNNYIDHGDLVFIYKNLDEDSPNEIFYKYRFRIICDKEIIFNKKL